MTTITIEEARAKLPELIGSLAKGEELVIVQGERVQPHGNFIDLCLNQYGFRGLPIEPAHTTQPATLPFPPGHKDPFDRMLIAQAIVEGLPILSVDGAFDAYPVHRIW